MLNSQGRKNIKNVFSDGLCMGCGICQDSCNKQAINLKVEKGYNRPYVDDSKCTNCGLCVRNCAGIGIDLQSIQDSLYNEPSIKVDRLIGRYLACYKGWSLDHEIRYHGASGGMVSQMLIYLLEKGLIDGAVVTGFQKDNPLRPEAYIARTKEEIFAGRSSKYCVVSFAGIAKQIMDNPGRYVVVGLPCHIHALRKYETTFKKFKENIFGYFAIYCSSTKTYNSIDYMMWRYGVEPSNVGRFTYRDDGCMGYMKIEDKKGDLLKKVKYLTYYIPMRSFFASKRCHYCIDHYGELADLCFGDIVTDANAEETIGESTFLVRNEKFKKIIEQATSEGVIFSEEITADFQNYTQQYAYKHKKGPGIVNAFSFARLLHLPHPKYDVDISNKITLKGIIREIIFHSSRVVGAHKCFWPIIKYLDKNKV